MEGPSFSTHDLLAQADAFLRAGDPTGAVARARVALRHASDADGRDACLLRLRRLEDAERAWRTEVLAREEAHRRRTEAEAGVVAERLVEASPRRRERPFRNLLDLVRRSMQSRRSTAVA